MVLDEFLREVRIGKDEVEYLTIFIILFQTLFDVLKIRHEADLRTYILQRFRSNLFLLNQNLEWVGFETDHLITFLNPINRRWMHNSFLIR